MTSNVNLFSKQRSVIKRTLRVRVCITTRLVHQLATRDQASIHYQLQRYDLLWQRACSQVESLSKECSLWS